MGFELFLFVVVAVVFCIVLFVSGAQRKIEAMTPEERNGYLFGAVNVHLVCPHCQTTGKVRVKSVSKEIVSTGTVGGILKTNTKSTTWKVVTQHHCDKCESTWDI